MSFCQATDTQSGAIDCSGLLAAVPFWWLCGRQNRFSELSQKFNLNRITISKYPFIVL